MKLACILAFALVLAGFSYAVDRFILDQALAPFELAADARGAQ